MHPNVYEVGGSIRNSLLGLPCKDHDFVYVDSSLEGKPVSEGFAVMKQFMLSEGFQIFLETGSCLTIRAKYPNSKLVADFVLARQEHGYIPGTRTPIVTCGNTYTDALRRDYKINTLLKNSNGLIIDYFNGQKDIEKKLISTPVEAIKSLSSDPLRALRAVRFALTLDFKIHEEIWEAFNNPLLVDLTYQTVSTERTREELLKCFKFNTFKTLELLAQLPKPLVECWTKNLWLKPTTEK